MCLLIALFQAHPDAPLIVAANRDERFSRPSIAMTVLQESGPRILGGRDEVAGGTWLATNEHGLIAGVTNRLSSQVARDPDKRSRGELPLALAGHRQAEEAVAAFQQTFRPADFNPAWLLAGDRDALFYIDMASGTGPLARALPPGAYVLENRPIDADSPKASLVHEALEGIEYSRGEALFLALAGILRSHRTPPSTGTDRQAVSNEAACVHGSAGGTRSSAIIMVPPDPARPPALRFADGPPCTSEFVEADLWG